MSEMERLAELFELGACDDDGGAEPEPGMKTEPDDDDYDMRRID